MPKNPFERWKATGKTRVLVCGRFHPLHKGHEALINAALSSGLTLHISLNSLTEPGRNPYSLQQRKHMICSAFPGIDPGNISVRDVGSARAQMDTDYVRLNIEHLSNQVSPEESVIFYTRKNEDNYDMNVDGIVHKNANIMDFIAKPRGPFDVQEVTQDMVKILQHGTDFRKDIVSQIDMLSPQIAAYVLTEHALANQNNRPVGVDPVGDKPFTDAMQSPDPSLTTGQYQAKLLGEGKSIIVDRFEDPKHKGNSR